MRVIEAVNHAHIRPYEVSVFLGGGITDCPDWQADTIKLFEKNIGKLPVVLLNPRRANFPIHDKSASQAQIEWEFDMLQRVDLAMFWFPCETLCPIVLYELGFQLGKRFAQPLPMYSNPSHLVIGTHPDYKRKQDVAVQTRLVDYRQKVFDTWHGTAVEAIAKTTEIYNSTRSN